jgi:hypothetical protein
MDNKGQKKAKRSERSSKGSMKACFYSCWDPCQYDFGHWHHCDPC